MKGEETQGNGAGVRSWFLLLLIPVIFLVWAILIYLLVGDKGPPPWDFGAVRDIPGESPFSSRYPFVGPQHIDR